MCYDNNPHGSLGVSNRVNVVTRCFSIVSFSLGLLSTSVGYNSFLPKVAKGWLRQLSRMPGNRVAKGGTGSLKSISFFASVGAIYSASDDVIRFMF